MPASNLDAGFIGLGVRRFVASHVGRAERLIAYPHPWAPEGKRHLLRHYEMECCRQHPARRRLDDRVARLAMMAVRCAGDYEVGAPASSRDFEVTRWGVCWTTAASCPIPRFIGGSGLGHQALASEVRDRIGTKAKVETPHAR